MSRVRSSQDARSGRSRVPSQGKKRRRTKFGSWRVAAGLRCSPRVADTDAGAALQIRSAAMRLSSEASASQADGRYHGGKGAARAVQRIFGSVDADIALPLRIRNTTGLPSPSAHAVSRITSARAHSRTRCSRLAFIDMADIVHTRFVALVSAQVEKSDFRRPGNGEHQNLERRLDAARPDPDERTVSMAAATPFVGQRQPVRHDVVPRAEQRSTRSQELSFAGSSQWPTPAGPGCAGAPRWPSPPSRAKWAFGFPAYRRC